MINLLQKIFSSFGVVLSHTESQKIFISWALKFVLHMATVLGFTIILALFVGEFGAGHLPELFGVEAFFSIVGTIVFSSFLKQFSQKKTLLVGALILFSLTILGFFLENTSVLLFFGVLIFGYSIIITQLNIIFSLFIEELFSPLESERAFPLVESAEPVGGIFAGIITGVGVSFLSPEYFILIWGGVILLIIPLLLLAVNRLEKIPKPHSLEDHLEREGIVADFKKSWFHIATNPYLKTLFFFVLIQFMVFNLIEFQYASSAAIEFSTSGNHGSAGGDAAAEELAHGLGMVHIVLYSLLLVFQLLFASKIQKRLGVVKTIFLHPLMVFFSAVLMTVKFSFISTVVAKGTFEVFGGPARNAYHASFYAFRPHVRERAKEFLEGVARPMGMLLGTLLILAVQGVVSYFHLPLLLMTSVISFFILIFLALQYLKSSESESKYTLLAKKNLETRGRAPEKLDAIEILSQNGHKNASLSLVKVLKMKNEKLEVKIQILKTLGALKDVDAIPEILKCFSSSEEELQKAAVEALAEYENLGNHFLTQAFAKHRVIEVLQKIFLESKSKTLKKLVIQVFQNIRHPEIIPFLLESLKSNDEDTVLGAIRVCGMFKDVSSAHYIEPFLESKNPQIQASAIIAMWQFPSYRLRLTVLIASLFEKKDEIILENAIYIVGEIKGIHEFKRLLRILKETDNIHIKKHIYVALAKMEHSIAVQEIVEMLMHENKDFSDSVRKLIFSPTVAGNIKKAIRHYLEQNIAHKIHSLLRKEGEEILEKMKVSTLQKLYDAYEIIGEKKEMMKISEVLEKKERVKIQNTNKEGSRSIISQKKEIPSLGQEISLDDLLG